MQCSYCGTDLQNSEAFCPQCGKATGMAPPPEAPYGYAPPPGQPYEAPPQPYEAQPQQYQGYQPPYTPYTPQPSPAPLVLGIIGIVCSFWFQLATLGCSIPGLIMAVRQRKSGANPSAVPMVLNIVGLVIAVISTIIYAALIISVFSLVWEELFDYYRYF